jgi:hypothetical protein
MVNTINISQPRNKIYGDGGSQTGGDDVSVVVHVIHVAKSINLTLLS